MTSVCLSPNIGRWALSLLFHHPHPPPATFPFTQTLLYQNFCEDPSFPSLLIALFLLPVPSVESSKRNHHLSFQCKSSAFVKLEYHLSLETRHLFGSHPVCEFCSFYSQYLYASTSFFFLGRPVLKSRFSRIPSLYASDFEQSYHEKVTSKAVPRAFIFDGSTAASWGP